MSTFSQVILDTRTMANRNLRKSIRNPDTLLVDIIQPIMTMLIFVFVFGGAIKAGDSSYINYIIPSILLLCIAQCGTKTAVGISTDIEKGIVDRFRSMPIAKSSVLTGHVLGAVVRAIIPITLIFMVAFLIGFRPSSDITGWLVSLGLLLLFSLTISWLAVAFGLIVKSAEGAGAFTMFAVMFSYLNSGFVPTDTLPVVLRVFAENQPMTPIIEALRALLLGTAVGNNLLLAVIWCVGLLVVAYIVAIQMYKRKLLK